MIEQALDLPKEEFFFYLLYKKLGMMQVMVITIPKDSICSL